jgi:cadherin EGF LAG seven-pass G-type receptor 1
MRTSNIAFFFRFATQSDSGLLLYNGRYNEKHDFIALEIVDGAIRFSFSLGSNITTTVATLPHRVSDGNWHSVTVQYFNKVKVTFEPFLQIITLVD